MNQQKIFISYARTDGQAYAVELARQLRSAGANIWLDQVDIEPGKLWDFEIEKALQSAEAVIFIATEKSTGSNNVLNEVYYALEENKEVIPVIFHDCKMPFRLKRLQYIDFTKDYDTAFSRLLKTLDLTPVDGGSTNKDIKPEKKDIPPVIVKPVPDPPPPREPVDNLPPVQRPVIPAPPQKVSNTGIWMGVGAVLLVFIIFLVYAAGSSQNHPAAADNHSEEKIKEADKKAAPVEAVADGWKNLSENNYSINYPADWDLNKNAGMGTSFVLMSPSEGQGDNFRENVTLIIQDLTGRNIDLDKFTDVSEGQIRTMISNSVLLQSQRLNGSQGEYQRIVYTGDQGAYHLKFEQYYWVQNEKAYILTFAAAQDKYSLFKSTAEKLMNSFSFKG